MSKKGLNLPDTDFGGDILTPKDLEDIEYGANQDYDYVALSFVQTAADIEKLKQLLLSHGSTAKVIAKIETKKAISSDENLEEIVKASDGIMVARGDLGVEVAPELVPLYQKKMIKLANQYGKVVITATHMLESMIENPRPTRAEASDVANAILDGTDAIMLSGESAIGKYPVESVEYMVKIAKIAETMIDSEIALMEAKKHSNGTINDAISMAASEIAMTIPGIKAIFAFTETGGTAKRIFKFRPKVPVIACTNSIETSRKLAFYRGIHSVIAKYVDDMSMCDQIAKSVAESIGLKYGDKIVITAGFDAKHGITNTLRIIELK